VRSTADRYTRLHRIATGGMGEVWCARDEVLHRDVAVKYLKHEFADDEGARRRFLNEARSAAALIHPGIATVFDFGESEVADGLPFLVMEYVEGQPLSSLLSAREPLDPEQARSLVEQAATALATAHALDVVHRDVKPGNLMVTPDDTVKVTDFGIARAGDGLALTATGQVLGTPTYLSPEQAEGAPATPASDVYSLGVVLFECLTGRPPYTADSPVALALAHVREPVPELPPDVPAELAEVTRRALAKRPGDRYADAGAFAAALAALAPEQTGEQTRLLTVPVAAAAAPSLPGGLAGRLRLTRDRWPAALGIALGALFLVVLVVAALTPDGGATDDTPGSGSSTPPSDVTPGAPATVRVRAAAYVGSPAAEVQAALAALGLRTSVAEVPNPGGHTAGTVAGLDPTGSVQVGATVTVQVWGAAPAPPKKKTGPAHGPDKAKGHGKKGKH
jgi:serine/threonine-protein kinase